MNRLQHESSPYLQQHATNPVDWYPWSSEALDRAKQENKPILVSIGYSTCHWCHVMERESFEDEAVARLMNEHFVCIKVDREERPDVDQLYMEACQAMTGSGGWPLNAFLLPDARPFYAGTYFPPSSRHNRPGWSDLLQRIAQLYREQPVELQRQAEQLTKGIEQNNHLFITEASAAGEGFSQEALNGMIGQLKQRYDLQRGGFGGAPKFPMSQSLELLLDHGLINGDQGAIQLVGHAMTSMIAGGIYDQLGGGFSRYTVDAAWLVPHFEKMLYDNALLLRLMAKLEMHAPAPIYRDTIRETIEWLTREMRTPEGAFYAALDADSEGVEGKFYVWDHAELVELCTPAELDLLTRYFGVTSGGSWAEEHTNILHRATELPASERAAWQDLKQKLLTHRALRIRPGRDEKIILQWNALMISGLAYCYRATGEARYRSLATEAYAALELLLSDQSQWYRNYKDGKTGKTAFLDDLTALNTARLDLYDITFDLRFIRETEKSVLAVMERFGGAPGGLHYLIPPAESELPVPTLDLYDNALPSGNGQLLHLLRRLANYTGKTQYLELATDKVSAIGDNVLKYPSSFANLGRLLLLLNHQTKELVISGERAGETATALLRQYRPLLTVVVATTNVEDFPLFAGRFSEKSLQMYLCENQTCRLPVSTIEALEL